MDQGYRFKKAGLYSRYCKRKQTRTIERNDTGFLAATPGVPRSVELDHFSEGRFALKKATRRADTGCVN